MTFDYSKLRGKIREKCKTQESFAHNALSISSATLSEKLNGKSDFSHKEIAMACSYLGIPTDEIKDYFFCEKS